MIIAFSLGLWIVISLLSGDLLMTNALDMLDETDLLGSHFYLALVALAFASVVSLPWLLWMAMCDTIYALFRR